MALSIDILEAMKMTVNDSVRTAVSDSINSSVSEAMKSNMEDFKDSINKLNKSVHDLVNKQDLFESRCEDRINTSEKAVDNRQSEAEARNAEKFACLERKVSDLDKTIKSSASFPTSMHFQQNEVHQSTIRTRLQQTVQTNKNISRIESIKEIVNYASTVLGLGPIKKQHIEVSAGSNYNEKIFTAAMDFLRRETAVKEDEIMPDDIIKVFSADNPSTERLYVQFLTKDLATLVLNLTRRLRKPELNVVLYIQREFKRRFNAIKSVNYRLRKLSNPKHKTGLEYSDSDIVLFAFPSGHFKFSAYHIDGLPEVDFTPPRTPPTGRVLNGENRGR